MEWYETNISRGKIKQGDTLTVTAPDVRDLHVAILKGGKEVKSRGNKLGKIQFLTSNIPKGNYEISIQAHTEYQILHVNDYFKVV